VRRLSWPVALLIRPGPTPIRPSIIPTTTISLPILTTTILITPIPTAIITTPTPGLTDIKAGFTEVATSEAAVGAVMAGVVLETAAGQGMAADPAGVA
jgi:hypothetical protein